MRNKILLLFAYIFGGLATLCCLPPLIFLLFGLGISLSIGDALEPYRWYLSALAILCFLLYLKYFQKTCKMQTCTRNPKLKWVHFILGFFLGAILFYPEFLGWFYA